MATPSKAPGEFGVQKLFLVPTTIKMLQSGTISEESFKLDGFDVKSVSFLIFCYSQNHSALGCDIWAAGKERDS